jgi:hypothetical protein
MILILFAVLCWTTINAANFTEEAIWEELKQKRTSFIYDAVGQRGYARSHSPTFPLSNYIMSL